MVAYFVHPNTQLHKLIDSTHHYIKTQAQTKGWKNKYKLKTMYNTHIQPKLKPIHTNYTHIHTNKHTNTHTNTHTHKHINTYTHIQTHT